MEKTLETILNKSAELIKAEEYDKALKLLEEEKNNPLNSLDIQSVLEDRINQLSKFIKQNEYTLRLLKADKATLIKMFNSEGYEFTVLDSLLEKFADKISTADCYRLQQVFLDDEIPNEYKLHYLNSFKDAGIKFKFQYHNPNTNKTFEVDTSKDFSIYNFENIFKVYDKLDGLYFKETSKDSAAKQIINAIYHYYFNDYSKLPYDSEALFNNIVDYVEHAFNSIYPLNNEFSS